MMNEKMITCINCPVGCRMTVTLSEDGSFLSVSGNTCPRGASYARQECTLPERMITAVVPVQSSIIPLSVKTSRPVPKDMIFAVMNELKYLHLEKPSRSGQVIIADVLGTGADILATRNLI